ncbi:MAG: DMT family transporter [Anaerolineales bacterium]
MIKTKNAMFKMLKSELALGLAVAVATGCVIAIQTAFLSRSGPSLGALRSGLLTTITGAVLASAVLLILWRMGSGSWQWNSSIWVALILGGILGTVALVGISFASQRVGITAALASILLGQMLVSVFIDAGGFGSTAAIPFSFERLIGLLLLSAGVYLLLFRQ